MKLSEMGLKTKIMIAMAVPSVIALILTFGALYGRSVLMETFFSVDSGLETIVQAREIEAAAFQMQDNLRGFLLTGTKSFLELYNATKRDVAKKLEQLQRNVASNPDASKSVDAVKKVVHAWHDQVALPAIERRKGAADDKATEGAVASVVRGNDSTYYNDLSSRIDTLIRKERAKVGDLRESAQRNHWTTQRIFIIAVVIWGLWNLWFWYKLSHSITVPIEEAANLAEAITNGDLSRELRPRGTDQVGRLVTALNEMVSNLRNQAALTSEGIKVLSESVNKIHSTATQLADGTTKTSAAVSQTTATFEEVKQSAKVSIEKARKVAEDSHRAVQISEEGKRATEEALTRMHVIKGQMESIGETVIRLSEHSQAIEAIVDAVQDIAEQSNLLAVNASIEAARAGDHGKGFSVVAQEIKILADQSSTATDQVRSILQETRKWINAVVMATEQGGKAVEAGVHQSNVAGKAIESLSGTVTLSAQAATVINTSTEQQFVGLDQVAGGMLSIDEAMRQNLQGTLELERAARSLQDLSATLKELVKQYKA